MIIVCNYPQNNFIIILLSITKLNFQYLSLLKKKKTNY